MFLRVPVHRGLIEKVEDGSNGSSSNHVMIQVCIKVVGQGNLLEYSTHGHACELSSTLECLLDGVNRQ
jgi:hypothetical protein